MTREDIIRMAREAEFKAGEIALMGDNFIRFASLIAAYEREQSAKIVENYCGAWDDQGYALANSIRARGEK